MAQRQKNGNGGDYKVARASITIQSSSDNIRRYIVFVGYLVGKPVQRLLDGIHRDLTTVSRKSLYHPISLVYLCFIKHKQQGKMKATNIIIAAVLILSANVLFAGNDSASTNVANNNTTMSVAALAPEVPAEADFEDAFVFDFISLAPALPAEAWFEDLTPETVSAFNLAPLAPAVADFE
jgi:hypothetical protein